VISMVSLHGQLNVDPIYTDSMSPLSHFLFKKGVFTIFFVLELLNWSFQAILQHFNHILGWKNSKAGIIDFHCVQYFIFSTNLFDFI
jgi:hypothetical protein